METPYQKYRRSLREKSFEILGNCCSMCGEKDPVVLCIDHLEPNQKDKTLTITNQIEIVAKPEEAFKKYQLLCHNCNWRKMVNNNERRKPREKPFAYQEDLELLEREIEKIKKSSTWLSQKKGNEPTEESLESILIPKIRELLNEKSRKLDVNKLTIFLRNQNIRISRWRAYQIKGNIEAQNPALFE